MGTTNKKAKAPVMKSKSKEPMRKVVSTKEKSDKPTAVAVTSATPNLGTKRMCPKCSAKFYDFGKEELNCPKCNAKLKASDFKSSFSVPHEPKKPKPVVKVTPEAVLAGEEEVTPVASDDTFESVEDLSDAEETSVVADIDVGDDSDSY